MPTKRPAPVEGHVVSHVQRGDLHCPVVILSGPAPAEGAAFAVRLGNGVAYEARAVAVTPAGDGARVETAGLLPID